MASDAARMRKVATVALVGLSLAGCASEVSLSDRLAGPSRVRGDADAVSVYGMGSRVEALPLAVGHCSRFHKSAQFDRKREDAYAFRCVAN